MTDTHTEALVKMVALAMQNAELNDGDEGNTYRLFDLLGFSGENKAVMITRQLARAAIEALPARNDELMMESTNESKGVLLAISIMMDKHVDNWPHPKKVSTALGLISKTLAAQRDEIRALQDAPEALPTRNDERALKLVEAVKTAIQHAYEEGVEDGTEWAETTKFQGEQEPQWIDSVARIEALKLEALSTNTDIIGKLVECLERIADDDCPRVPDRLRIPGQECCDHGKHLDDQRCSDCIRDFARTTLSEARKAMKGDDRG